MIRYQDRNGVELSAIPEDAVEESWLSTIDGTGRTLSQTVTLAVRGTTTLATTFDPEKHPRGHDGNPGEFAAKGEVVGKGSTGEVHRHGDEVFKSGLLKDGSKSPEGKVYAALNGVEGIAAGRGEGDKVRLPFYKNIVGVDTIPEKQRIALAPMIAKQKGRINSAISALSEAGYDYNDPLQFGVGTDKQFNLLDFSNASRESSEEALSNNISHLKNFYDKFGMADEAKRVGKVHDTLVGMRNILRDEDGLGFWDSEIGTPTVQKLKGQLDGKEPNYAYYATNARHIGIGGIAQTESKDGIKVVLSHSPLSAEQMKQWEVTPVIHQHSKAASQKEASEHAVTLALDDSVSEEVAADPAEDVLQAANAAYEKLSKRVRRELLAAMREGETFDALARARSVLEKYEPILAAFMSDVQLAALLTGMATVASKVKEESPELTEEEPTDFPPYGSGPVPAGEAAPTRNALWPVIDEAVRSLRARRLLPREQYDLLSATAKQAAFTVAGVESAAVLLKVRDTLADVNAEGETMREFDRRVEEATGEGTFLSPAHMETVWRNGIMSAYSKGQETLLEHPLVDELFPYAKYAAVHDDRVRPEHKALEKLGINGGPIYDRRDPTWRKFVPPFDFGCRCAWFPISVREAARQGVPEAVEAVKSGQPPRPHFVEPPPFSPPVGFDRTMTLAFVEAEHPRGHEGNPGEFAKKPVATNSSETAPIKAASPEDHAQAAEDYKKNGTKAKAFKEWFGDWESDPEKASKVVNDEDQPLPVFHGSNHEFDAFEAGHSSGVAGYFTTSKKYAATYAGGQVDDVKTYYLNIRNPLDLRKAASRTDFSSWMEWLEEAGMDTSKVDIDNDDPDRNGKFQYFELFDTKVGVPGPRSNLVREIKRQGFDGIIGVEGNSLAYLAFEPTQIKAVANAGTFDPENQNITLATATEATSKTEGWITIGGVKGGDGKRHGGSPVYVKNGRITKGHPSLQGKTITALKEGEDDSPAAPELTGTKRQQSGQKAARSREENRQGGEYSRAVSAKQARKEGIDPKHLHQLAAEMMAHHKAFSDDYDHMLQSAKGLFAHYGYDARALTSNLRSGHVEDDIPGLDAVSYTIANEYPQHFVGTKDARGAEEKLLEILKQGKQPPLSQADAYEQALEVLRHERNRGRGKVEERPIGDEPEHDDTVPFSTEGWALATEEMDDAEALATFYAGLFNDLDDAGEYISDEDQAAAHDELDGTGWTVTRNEDAWQAVHDDEVELSTDAQGHEHAGKGEHGGQFIQTVYHGSPRTDLKEFGSGTSGGAFFADDKDVAQDFAKRGDGEGRVYAAKLALKNPLDLREHGQKVSGVYALRDYLISKGMNPKEAAKHFNVDEDDPDRSSLWHFVRKHPINQEIRKHHDGMIFEDYGTPSNPDAEYTSYVAFHPHQIQNVHDRPTDLSALDDEEWTLSAERTPTGGIQIASKFFRGGQFVPGAVIADASPEDKKRLAAAKDKAETAKAQRADARKARGSVDVGKLAARLAPHVDAGKPLTKRETASAASAFRMLKQHHGDLALHRVEELADQVERTLAGIDDEHPNADGLREQFGKRLAQLHAMMGHAEKAGVTGYVPPNGMTGEEANKKAADYWAARKAARGENKEPAAIARKEPKPEGEKPPLGFVRAKNLIHGGEFGPNGEFYPAGAFIDTKGREKIVPVAPEGGQGGGPAKPNEEEEAKRRERGQSMSRDPEEERKKQEDRKRWDDMNAGPLGKVKWLGNHPNSKAFSNATVNLKDWKGFAEEVGEEGMKRIVEKLEPILHKRIDDGVAESREKQKGTSEEHKKAMGSIDDDYEQWEKNQVKELANQDIGYGMTRHHKSIPSSLYARQLVEHLLDNSRYPSGKDTVENAHEINEALKAATQPKEESKDAVEKGQRSEVDQSEHPHGEGGGKTASPGGSDSPEQGREEQQKEVTGLKDKEASIAKGDKEKGFIVGRDGRVLAELSQRGDSTELTLTDDEEKKSKDAILTHNHPGGGGPSVGDFIQATRLDLHQLRVVTPDGVVHAITRPEGGWPKTDIATPDSKILARVQATALKETDAVKAAGRFADNKEARAYLNDATAKELAKEMGIPYQREKQPEPVPQPFFQPSLGKEAGFGFGENVATQRDMFGARREEKPTVAAPDAAANLFGGAVNTAPPPDTRETVDGKRVGKDGVTWAPAGRVVQNDAHEWGEISPVDGTFRVAGSWQPVEKPDLSASVKAVTPEKKTPEQIASEAIPPGVRAALSHATAVLRDPSASPADRENATARIALFRQGAKAKGHDADAVLKEIEKTPQISKENLTPTAEDAKITPVTTKPEPEPEGKKMEPIKRQPTESSVEFLRRVMSNPEAVDSWLEPAIAINGIKTPEEIAEAEKIVGVEPKPGNWQNNSSHVFEAARRKYDAANVMRGHPERVEKARQLLAEAATTDSPSKVEDEWRSITDILKLSTVQSEALAKDLGIAPNRMGSASGGLSDAMNAALAPARKRDDHRKAVVRAAKMYEKPKDYWMTKRDLPKVIPPGASAWKMDVRQHMGAGPKYGQFPGYVKGQVVQISGQPSTVVAVSDIRETRDPELGGLGKRQYVMVRPAEPKEIAKDAAQNEIENLRHRLGGGVNEIFPSDDERKEIESKILKLKKEHGIGS